MYSTNKGDADLQPQKIIESQESHNSLTGDVPVDTDGYKKFDFNRYLISYNEYDNLNLRHIFLAIPDRNELMNYSIKIMETACQDKIVLAIQRDNQLADSYAIQLRARGFWVCEITNKTRDPEKLLKMHSVYRALVTTASYLRDNVDKFQMFPSVIINFDLVISHVKFLERFLNYRHASNALKPKDCSIYEMGLYTSTTSEKLKQFLKSQDKPQ